MTDFCTHFVTHFVTTVFKLEQWSTPGLVDNRLVNGANMFKISKNYSITKLWRHQVTTFLTQFFNKGNFFQIDISHWKKRFHRTFANFPDKPACQQSRFRPVQKILFFPMLNSKKRCELCVARYARAKMCVFFAREKSNFTKSVTHFVATVFKIEHWATPGFVDYYLVHGANMFKISENDIINVLWRHDVTSL